MKQFAAAAGALAFALAAAGASRVLIVSDAALEPPARYGLEKLQKAVTAKGYAVERAATIRAAGADFLVIANAGPGKRTGSCAATPQAPEALAIRLENLQGKPALVLCGADARGLMYAALDAAQRVSWSADPGRPFAHLRDTTEKPYMRDRAVSMYTMQRASFESRLYDPAQWRAYFDLLAASRINSFVVIFGYENGGFMAPLYPYFFDLEQFPEVKLVGLTAEQQKRNVAAFRAMIRTAHERGINVTVAVWDHIYRGGVQGGGIEGAAALAGRRVPGLVWGVTADNLNAYTKAALRKLLEVFPEADALQFRMHDESGLKPSEMQAFWHQVFQLIKQARPDLPVDIRAKGLPDSIIDDGLEQGLRLRVTTKYWMEQMGLPFHPTHVNRQNQQERRHGYADLLRYPQRYKVQWRLWNGGTTRLLLWGDPEYVRRFIGSARLYQGDGYEVNEMLATKMLGEPHDAPPLDILNPRDRYYDYEFQRYWHFYQLWGRLGYNPETPAEIWEHEFAGRLGPEAGLRLASGLHLASQVLPRIVAASCPYSFFPTTRGWAEMMRMDDLPKYAAGHTTDTEQFQSAPDRARNILEGGDSAARPPEESSRWFAEIARRILAEIQKAESADHGRPGRPGATPRARNEFVSTVTDLRILACLAQYHSHRLTAAVHYSIFQRNGDLFAIDDAAAEEKQAVAAWERLVEAAGDVYSSALPFGVHRTGFSRHWKEELEKLRAGLEKLETERDGARLSPTNSQARIAHTPVRRTAPGQPLMVRASVGAEGGVRQAVVLVAEPGGSFKPVTMQQAGPGRYQAEIPQAAAEGELRYVIEVTDGGGRRAVYPPKGQAEPLVVTITADRQPPEVRLERPATARPGQALRVAARVTDPSGVRSVRLRFRHLTQFEDYRTLQMMLDQDSGLYETNIPGDFIVPQWDLIYFIEAVDGKGNGRIYPDLETETPYVVLPVSR
jgi:hypothetical protein